jgi:hypothetical protein
MDPQVLVLFPLAGPAVLGSALGRACVLVVPFAAVPIFYLGLLAGWWGAGVGDGWHAGFVIVLALSVLATAIGIGLRALTRRRGANGASRSV